MPLFKVPPDLHFSQPPRNPSLYVVKPPKTIALISRFKTKFLVDLIDIYSERVEMGDLFNQVLSQFQSQHQYDKFLKEAEKEYDIKIYRLHSFSRDYACDIFNQLHEKYRSGEFKDLPQGWHENQRRLYVWFIVCFIHLKMLEPNKFVDHDKYWKNIALTLCRKDPTFLKYQLLTLIKTRGRIVWKDKEDQLLREAFKKHEKGQWNEVAKYLYFQSREQCFKTPKKCRQRWQNHLNDQIKKGEWTTEEDKIIFEFVKKTGTHWASIVPLLKQVRTEHMIKNRYKSIVSKLMEDKKITENEAVDQELKKLDYGENQNCEEDSRRDDHGILLVQSEEFIDEEEKPPMVERKKKTSAKKRGRPKKVCNKAANVVVNETKHVSQVNQVSQGNQVSRSNPPSRRRSFNFNEESRAGQNPSECVIEGFSLSKRQPQFFENFSNHFGRSQPSSELFNSGRLSFNSSRVNFNNIGFNYLTEDDKNSLFIDQGSSRFRNRDGFEPILLQGESLLRSRRMSFKTPIDSFVSGVFK